MNNYNICKLLLAAAPLCACSPSKECHNKPNILYIMSDDHTSQAIGVYESRLASLNPTPNIDRIGREGVVMTNAFSTNSISTPSRACIITGQYGNVTEVYDLDSSLPIEEQYLPQEMHKLGYQTAMVGKWHLGEHPESFDYYNIFYGQGRYFDPVLIEKDMPQCDTVKYPFKGKEYVVGKMYEGHSSDVVTDISLDWLENKRDKSKPFFLCHHFKAPHDLFEYSPRYEEYLEDEFIPEPESLWDNQNNGSIATRGENGSLLSTIGSSVGKRNTIRNMGMHMDIDLSLSDDDYKRASYQEYLKRYLRCVKGVDDNVKRILDYLEQTGELDNTIIIYTGDQGFALGEHDYIDKRWMYDETMRMPFLVRYPKEIEAGSKTDAIVNNVDFAETIIDMAGGKAPEQMQGESFKEILYSGIEPEKWKKSTYYRYWMHMAHNHCNPAHFGIRTKDFKLILFYGLDYIDRDTGGKPLNGTKISIDAPDGLNLSRFQTPAAWELYDLRVDPEELNNCYDDPSYKGIIAELKEQLKDLRDNIVKENDEQFPEIQKVIEESWNK
ncbi:MAG: sulfatase [Rikenellaceae bacterium]